MRNFCLSIVLLLSTAQLCFGDDFESLRAAMVSGDVAELEELLKNGADPNSTEMRGRRPLMFLIEVQEDAPFQSRVPKLRRCSTFWPNGVLI
jgi:hypothetical protein